VGRTRTIPLRHLHTLTVVWHRTAWGVVETCFGLADSERPQRLGGGWGNVAPAVLLARIRKAGSWGFYNPNLNEAHLWARRGSARRAVFTLVFHEVLHAFVPLRGRKAHAAMEPIEAAAELAYKIMERAHRRMNRRRR
jgi:hypothetical protein